ncbi:MAG: ATP-binding cassette domain-containing protein [Clostridiales bacterium]|jgi:NitT/TauT family transport system ATP-binding protein|nr:ATP-binding cassette domain-containing protein [Clostridiales bacterium]
MPCGTEGIALRNISKSYDGRFVLRDVSLTFAEGGRYCLTGPSGCGKTTLLHIVMGIVAPDSGTVTGMDGRAIAPVFQENRLCENLSAGTNLRIAARGKLKSGQAAEMLDRLLLPETLHKPVRTLSGGMKRRVAIARALLSGGGLLLFDEPFRELDEGTKARVLDEVRRELSGKTLILVTHDPDEGARLGCEPIRFPAPAHRP